METIAGRTRHIAVGVIATLLMLLAVVPLTAYAADTNYDASAYDAEEYPGVYVTKVSPNGATSATAAPAIHIPSITDEELATEPTTASPAIICGTAVKFADQENARAFQECSARVAPYSDFKYTVTDLTDANGNVQYDADGKPIKKLSGFDGSYFIVRINVEKLWGSVDEDKLDSSYLHIRQDKNNALLVKVGMDTFEDKKGVDGRDQWGNYSFSNLYAETGADGKATGTQFQRTVTSLKLSEMCDNTGRSDEKTPYFDVILFSTSAIVSGADAQKEGALNGDVELSFYIDQTADYDTSVNWDPASQDTTLADKCFNKFYNEKTAADNGAIISRYLVKGSELAIDSMVLDETASDEVQAQPWKYWLNKVPATFWSLAKSIKLDHYNQPIDESASDTGCGRTITLISEVPVVDNLQLTGGSAEKLKKRTLNVNSFDIQVANNKSTADGVYTSGLELENAWLKIADMSNTTGAELAIGNNATMTIKSGGKLVVDKTCQLEIEWDGATVTPATEGQPAQPTDILNNGSLDLRPGGEVQNDGVITIEGTEGKPYQPGTEQQASSSEKGHGELTICAGAKFTNNGCFMPNGALYVQGELINNGKFSDTIVSQDPDRGVFTYHKGIQCTWKDDVTQDNVIYGGIYVGMDKTWQPKDADKAVIQNNGDIVICPGELVVMEGSNVKNMPNGGIYLCATDRAIIPIEPDPAAPTVITKEVDLDEPAGGTILNWGTINNQGEIRPGQVSVATNGSLNKLIMPGNYDDMFDLTCWEKGTLTGIGYVYKHNLKKGNMVLWRDGDQVDSAVYDGTAQQVGMSVIAEGDVVCGTNDFTVTYLDPSGATITEDKIVDAGTYQVVVKGQNAFTGKLTKTFTVTPAELTDATLDAASYTFNGKVFKPAVTAVKAGELAVTDANYTATYSNDNPVNAGTYKVTVAGEGNYGGKLTKTFTIKKAANTLKATAKAKGATLKKAKVKKAKQTIKRAKLMAVSKNQGKVTYTLGGVKKAKFKKFFKVNAKNGNITVKKGLKKGTYKVSIKVKAAGTANYNALTKTVTCTVKVK